MMKLTNIVVTWFLSGGALVILGVVSKHLNAFLVAKKSHNKAAEEREVLALVQDLADMAVTSLVGDNATGTEKFDRATKIVNSALANKGFDVQSSTVNHAVQAAYEKSNLTSNKTISKNEEPQLGLVVDGQPTDPVLKAVETAPNRANDVKEG